MPPILLRESKQGAALQEAPPQDETLSGMSHWHSVPSPTMDCHNMRCCTKRYNYPCLWKLSKVGRGIGLEHWTHLHSYALPIFQLLYISRCIKDRFSFATFDHEFIAALIPAKMFHLSSHFQFAFLVTCYFV